MAHYDVTLVALNIRKWDIESQRISLTTYFVLDDEEKSHLFDLSISLPPEMVEEFLGKLRVGCLQKLKNNHEPEDENVEIAFANETYVRQKLYSYFKRVLNELNNPKRKKGQSKMIFTTHMDVFNESQDITFLPQIIQFYVVLNWARKYYEKEDYQRAVDPLRKLVKIKPDFGLGYKWLARSLKKIRRYDEATNYYEKYAEVDNSLDAWLDLAKSYRKGKLFDKSEEIYNKILKDNPEEKEARMGMAQIKYARNESGYLQVMDEAYHKKQGWLRKWLLEEFNFRIYISRKTPLSPVNAARYLGYDRVFELTQKAFRNEVPSHFNPTKARMSFYKEELDNWAMIMNRYECFPEEIKLYPENIKLEEAKPVDVDIEEEGMEEAGDQAVKPRPVQRKKSTRVEAIIKKIKAARTAQGSGREAGRTSESLQTGAEEPVKRRRGRPPKKKTESQRVQTASSSEDNQEKPKRRRGRPPKKDKENQARADSTNSAEQMTEKAKRPRGRPPKKKNDDNPGQNEADSSKSNTEHTNRLNRSAASGGNNKNSLNIPSEKELLFEKNK